MWSLIAVIALLRRGVGAQGRGGDDGSAEKKVSVLIRSDCKRAVRYGVARRVQRREELRRNNILQPAISAL